jgi:very-short-patch-repair endonuclease
MIRRAQKQIPPRLELVIKHGPDIKLDWPLKQALKVANEIVDHMTAGKRLGGMQSLFKREWKVFVRGCHVDGGPPETVEHFRAIQDLLAVYSMRQALARRWDRQMVPLGAPSAAELGRDIENAAMPYAQHMRTALSFAEHGLAHCEALFRELGLDFGKLLKETPLPSVKHGDLIRLRIIMKERLPALIDGREAFISKDSLLLSRSTWPDYLDSVAEDGGPYAQAMAEAIREGNLPRYTELYEQVTELLQKTPTLARRNELLAAVSARAPEWARAIRDRNPPHDGGRMPGQGDVKKAWHHRLLHDSLKGATLTDLDLVQNQLTGVSDALMRTTARYVEKLAWLAQVRRTGLSEQQALAGWLGLHKKIGKGSGKNAARLREEAKRTLARCRKAVPVWIMPLSRVYENFDMATTQFDVVILDEASQCDILALNCFAMARQVAVVGDHEQVSPYAVGHKVDKIQALIDELLHEIPNKQLYDGKTSVYDLARQSFGGTIRLLEHFRCVPDIIQFSNHLCYGGEIQALREASSAQVRPALVYHHVEGGIKDGKVNEYEAHEIASIVQAICEEPEYEGLSIGVICMVGTEQALRIDALLRRRLTAAEYQRRRLLCGNASQFQGDERDIVLLSMVDSPAFDGSRLTMKQRDDLKKVFNVAASRARDQLWVVHSLDPEHDLKDGDLRLKLLSHARSPDVLRKYAVNPYDRLPSRFEEDLNTALQARGYRTTLHGAVGQYRIDIVVEGGNGIRVAVLCDGDRAQTKDELTARLNRQSTLKRLGWPFIRVPASAYYSDPDAVLVRIQARLSELRVGRRGTNPAIEQTTGEELMARIQGKVASARVKWMKQLEESGYDPEAIRERGSTDADGRKDYSQAEENALEEALYSQPQPEAELDDDDEDTLLADFDDFDDDSISDESASDESLADDSVSDESQSENSEDERLPTFDENSAETILE